MPRHIITNRRGHEIEVEDALHEIFIRKEKRVNRAKEFFLKQNYKKWEDIKKEDVDKLVEGIQKVKEVFT